MAIKVNGTTVIDDSRNLSNVGGLKTVGGNSILGSGDIATGGSTAFGAVGTYMLGYTSSTSSGNSLASGATRSSNLMYAVNFSGASYGLTSVSGTWRLMGGPTNGDTGNGRTSVWVRIS